MQEIEQQISIVCVHRGKKQLVCISTMSPNNNNNSILPPPPYFPSENVDARSASDALQPLFS